MSLSGSSPPSSGSAAGFGVFSRTWAIATSALHAIGRAESGGRVGAPATGEGGLPSLPWHDAQPRRSYAARPPRSRGSGMSPVPSPDAGFVFGAFNDLPSFADLVDDDTCAILVETIQGESGVVPATVEFLHGLRDLCNRRNLLLLVDEVQSGLGRSGRFYAFEEAGIQPDAIAMAKGLGGGFPIAAMWVRENAADLFHAGMHGTTFGGTPLACAAALAVLDVIEKEKLLAHVQTESVTWHGALQALVRDFPKQVLAVRGRGFMVGVQLAGDPAPYLAAMREQGLLALSAGGNVVRLLPPLNATRAELAKSVEIFRTVLAAKA